MSYYTTAPYQIDANSCVLPNGCWLLCCEVLPPDSWVAYQYNTQTNDTDAQIYLHHSTQLNGYWFFGLLYITTRKWMILLSRFDLHCSSQLNRSWFLGCFILTPKWMKLMPRFIYTTAPNFRDTGSWAAYHYNTQRMILMSSLHYMKYPRKCCLCPYCITVTSDT